MHVVPLESRHTHRDGKFDWLLVTALTVAVAAVIAVAYAIMLRNAPRRGARHPLVGHRALGAELVRFDDAKPVNLIDVHGKFVVLTFWGTWCQPCAQEIPEFNALWERYKDHPDFEMLAVVCEPPDVPPGSANERLRTDTQEFIATNKLTMPIYLDPSGRSRAYYYLDKAPYPATALIDRNGMFRAYWSGPDAKKMSELAALLTRILPQSR
jgi:peroxiredoxin